MGIMDIEHASCESRSHLTTVVAVHAEGSALAQSLVPVGEFAKATSGKDRWVRSLEVSVDNESSVVDKAVPLWPSRGSTRCR